MGSGGDGGMILGLSITELCAKNSGDGKFYVCFTTIKIN